MFFYAFAHPTFQGFLKYRMASLCYNIAIPSGFVKRHFHLFDVNNEDSQ